MFLARVEGSVVATKKDPSMNGRKLLLLRPQLVDDKDPSKLGAAATLGYCLDPVYHPKMKTWDVTKVRIWLYDQIP